MKRSGVVLLMVAGLVILLILLKRNSWSRASQAQANQAESQRAGSLANSSSNRLARIVPNGSSVSLGSPASIPPQMTAVRPAAQFSKFPAASVSTLPEWTNLPPQTVLENMRAAFRQYTARFGGNPVGTNPEITAALNGGNSRHVQFLSPEDGLRVDPGGELVDSWGTPFFFHQLSGQEMEIHSAGPDRVMWTGDDLVIK